MVQTSITSAPERAYNGMLSDTGAKDVITAVLQSAAGITPGRFVVRDSTDEQECKVVSATADITSQTVLGVVLRDIAREPAVFAQYDSLSVLLKGRCFVTIEDAFSPGDEIWVRCVAGGGELAGAVRTAQDGTDCVRVPGVILTSGDAGDVGEIEINFPYPQEVDEMAESSLDSGTYTPTVTVTGNTTATSAEVGWYMRVGSVVFFKARATVTHTAGAPTASAFDISLPVASNLAAAGDLAGVVTGDGVSVGELQANATDNRATVSYSITGTGAKRVSISGSYTVI